MWVMSAWTTKRPGYSDHTQDAALPHYDNQFFKQQNEKDSKLEELLRGKDWHECVEQDTNEC